MSNAELATGYAALILADEGLEITADKLATLTKAAGIEVESIWTQLFAKALEGKDVKDLLLNVGGTNPSILNLLFLCVTVSLNIVLSHLTFALFCTGF